MKIEPFVKKYNWEGIDFPLEQYGKKKKIDKSNRTIALNVLYAKKE